MSDLLIRDVDTKLKQLLKARAREHGQSLSAEVTAILRQALFDDGPDTPLGTVLSQHFKDVAVELDFERQEPPRTIPTFE